MKDQEFFDQTPVFTHAEYVAHVQPRTRASQLTATSQLRYHVQAGHLVRVRRGLYAVVPRGLRRGADDAVANPYVVAGKLAPDAVLAYHAALQFHGYAQSVHFQIQYVTRCASRPLTFQGYTYRAVKAAKALRDADQDNVCVEVVDCEGLPLRVTNLERTLVDVLDRPDLAGGWDEAWRSLESCTYFDLNQVVAYTRLLGSAATAAKVGFFLEQHRDELTVEDGIIEELRAERPKFPQALTLPKRKTDDRMRFLKTWNLLVPEWVIQRTWEEAS